MDINNNKRAAEENNNNNNNPTTDPDTLVDEFDEKVGLHSESSAMAEAEDELDEKAALRQQDHQNELDALLEDTPPSSRFIEVPFLFFLDHLCF